MKIAIIEDDKELNLIISKILKSLNHEVESFFDGDEILNSQKTFDLYIIDINLPKVNGIDLIDLLPGKKIIISANTQAKTIDIAYKKGILDYIKKPFIKEELIHKLNKYFPEEVKILDSILKPNQRVLIKNDKIILLTKDEVKFLLFFKDKTFVTLEEIKQNINKEANSLYVFLSKLKKKTGIEFENIKGFGYQIKDKDVLSNT